MKALIRLLARLVERHAVLVVLVTLVATGGFALLAAGTETAQGQEGFSPENAEILASQRIGDLFGEEATQSVMQVIVRTPGRSAVSPEA